MAEIGRLYQLGIGKEVQTSLRKETLHESNRKDVWEHNL